MISKNRNGYANYGAPAGYNPYRWPYAINSQVPLPGSAAKVTLEVLTSTLINYDGQTLTGFVITATGAQAFTLTFDDDTAPPSTSTAINISGLGTTTLIAEQIALAFELNGFRVSQNGAKLNIYQPLAGDQGNVEMVVAGPLSDDLSINGIDDFVGFNVFFFGGSILIPKLWGPQRGYVPSRPSQVPFEQVPV